MSPKLTPSADREPRNLYAVLTNAGPKAVSLTARTRPNPDTLRVADLDMTTISDDGLIEELGAIGNIAYQAAESAAGIDDVDYWDRWQFDKICSPDLVVRLCDLIQRLSSDLRNDVIPARSPTTITDYVNSRGLDSPNPIDFKIYSGGWGTSLSLRNLLDSDAFKAICAAKEVVFTLHGFNEQISDPVSGPQGRLAALRDLLEHGPLGVQMVEERGGVLHVTVNWNFVG